MYTFSLEEFIFAAITRSHLMGLKIVATQPMFHQVDHHALESAMSRAMGLWYSYPGEFRQLMINGMHQDHSWASAGQHYLNIYEYICHK